MKYVITITDLGQRPEDWTSKTSWPGPGIYRVKDDTSLYHVHKYGVDYVTYNDHFVAEPFVDPGESVSETLLLKLVAAASRAEVLK